MKSKTVLIILILIISLVDSEISAQVEITKSSTAYYFEGNKIDLCFYVIKNTSDSTIFLWFDKEKDTTIPLQVRVNHYFFKVKGDFSFFSLLFEIEAGTAGMPKGGLLPAVGFTFIKELKTNQSFTVILKDISIDNISEDFIEIVPYSIFEQAAKPLDKKWFENIEYKEDFIVFSQNTIKAKKKGKVGTVPSGRK